MNHQASTDKSVDGGNFGKKKKTALIVTLVSVAVVLAATAAVLVLFVFNWERGFKKHVEERNWAKAEEVYEEKIDGNEKREEKADEILREAVDSLKEGYDSDFMEYSAVAEHLEAIEEFWDDSYVRRVSEEIASAEGQNALPGTWRATEIEAMGVTVNVSDYLEQMGMGDMKMEMSLTEDGRFGMDLMGRQVEGSWRYNGSTLTLTAEGEDLSAECEDGKITIEESGVKIIFEK